MNGQVQFNGNVPFTDHNTGQPVQVRVWGVYVGQGVDAHEEQAIQQWIMNALATSAASYQGNVYEIQSKAQEWGAWVSQQIAPGLAQAFQAQGQIHIQGVSLDGAGAPMGAAPMGAAAMGGAPMGGGDLQMAAAALTQRLGIPQQQAFQAAQIVMETLSGGGAYANQGVDPYKAKAAKKGADPYAKKGADPYAKKGADPYAKKGADPYAKKGADPYAKKGADPYAKKGADPYAKKGAPAYKAEPSKKDQWKK